MHLYTKSFSWLMLSFIPISCNSIMTCNFYCDSTLFTVTIFHDHHIHVFYSNIDLWKSKIHFHRFALKWIHIWPKTHISHSEQGMVDMSNSKLLALSLDVELIHGDMTLTSWPVVVHTPLGGTVCHERWPLADCLSTNGLCQVQANYEMSWRQVWPPCWGWEAIRQTFTSNMWPKFGVTGFKGELVTFSYRFVAHSLKPRLLI